MKKDTRTSKFHTIYKVLLIGGWKEHRTDAGRCFAKGMGNEFLVLNLHETFLKDSQNLAANWFLHSDELSKIGQAIFPNKQRTWLPLRAFIEAPQEQEALVSVSDKEEYSAADAEKLICKITAWGQAVDVNRTIQNIANASIPNVGGAQLKYLAALAYVGDFNTLMDYQAAFQKGRRLNFTPMIKPEMIDRAVDIALERA
ncbi:hypothetical protein SAMN02744133_104201 [Thalassospira xiamenensis M-5 = DSM 17429]|uniref:Uncharacterized protein n=1 Tax=Thalassospira xiamenensis M-5 = DSM 17429 TaxID=1123366 RepID=A0AB72UCG2_9PROT|nr:hypothetical protein [Thalassospira xiamenensis]AJD51763.1 hypothetical protein TH3_08225 [Thalassospira xiamenensis M-5 = DSM 17429]SIT00883.1 hypothetical protein SAMN02744133_104201 [Thalassospira xiamenensis M-5 = DSM 17429]